MGYLKYFPYFDVDCDLGSVSFELVEEIDDEKVAFEFLEDDLLDMSLEYVSERLRNY
jgi:hypothetical protein